MTSTGARGGELDAASPEGVVDDDPTVNAFEKLNMIRCGRLSLAFTQTLHTQLRLARTRLTLMDQMAYCRLVILE